MELTELIGLSGAVIAGIAYLPQIIHLIQEHCSAGISRKAFSLWLVAAVAVFMHAFRLGDTVFLVLGGIQVIATIIILFLATKYQGRCASHGGAKQ
jgi:uncharacterized protein with PQ loop repeat